MLPRKVVIIGIALIVVGLAVSVYLLHVPRDMFAPIGKVTGLATTSADEHSPVWSPDGSKIFFKLTESIKADGYIRGDTWICSVNTYGSQREKLVKIEEHPDFRSNIVLSSDMKKVFYTRRTFDEVSLHVLQLTSNDPKVRQELKALEDEYGAHIEEQKVGISNDIANVVFIARSYRSIEPKERTYVLDVYLDLRNEIVVKVDRIKEVKIPVGEENKIIYEANVMDIDGKNRGKIAELAVEEEYVQDWGYIGGSIARMYEMYSWSPDRTKIFFTKLEATGYVWVWKKEEKKWMRYKAGTESSIPVLQEENWKGRGLIAKEHERTAWIWDLKDNELRFIGHLSYGIVHILPQEEVVWSPDGKHVALPSSDLSGAGATEQIFVINRETGESKRLTSFVGSSTWPKWSTDSKKMVFARILPEYWWFPSLLNYKEGSDVWVVDIDGSNETQLTDVPKNWENGWLNPDGSKVVYASGKKSMINVGETQKIGIWVVNVDGGDRKLLAKIIAGGVWDMHMEWSPDGSKIAVVTWVLRENGLDHDIYLIDVPK